MIQAKCRAFAVPWTNDSGLQSAMRNANIELKAFRTLVVVYGYDDDEETGNEDLLLCEGERLESERDDAKRVLESEREYGGDGTNHSSLENVAFLDVRRDRSYKYNYYA